MRRSPGESLIGSGDEPGKVWRMGCEGIPRSESGRQRILSWINRDSGCLPACLPARTTSLSVSLSLLFLLGQGHGLVIDHHLDLVSLRHLPRLPLHHLGNEAELVLSVQNQLLQLTAPYLILHLRAERHGDGEGSSEGATGSERQRR